MIKAIGFRMHVADVHATSLIVVCLRDSFSFTTQFIRDTLQHTLDARGSEAYASFALRVLGTVGVVCFFNVNPS